MDFFDLFSDVPESLVVVSPEYKILAATNAYLQETMRTREEIVGRHFLREAFPEKDVAYEDNPVKLALDKTLATKKTLVMNVIRYDLEIPQDEGGGYKELYWETSYVPGLDQEGNVKYIIQKAVNVTERELARQGQALSEIKFKIMTDTVPQIIFTMDGHGKLNYVNRRWENYTGLTIRQALNDGSDLTALIHPEDLPGVLARAQEAFNHGAEFQAELRIRNKEGYYRWFMSKGTPVKLEENGEIIMWVGSSTDIHSTKEMVQELLLANEHLATLSDQVQQTYAAAESQRLTLERLIMQAPALFAILKGPQHHFELVNPPYKKLFPKRQLLGKTVAEAIPEIIDQGFIQILDKVYQTGEPFVAEEIPVQADWKDSGQLEMAYFTTTYQPLWEGDKVTGIIAFGYEVTDTVKLRQQLQQLSKA